MKKIRIILLVVVVGLLMVSCDKDPLPNPDPKTMNDLVIKADFDWKTTKDYQITISGKSSRVVQLAAADGTIYKKGFVTPQVALKVKLTIAAYITSIQIRYSGQDVTLNLTGPILTYTFN